MNDIRQALGSFLPLKLLQHIHGQHGVRPAAVEFPAAVIFVDISRYTALVEQFARRGQGGLEGIPGVLGRSYTRCVDQIIERGGEVLCLAGDELLAYWAADGESLAQAVRQAADCAEAICRNRSDGPESAGEAGPALHIGIGAGQLWAAAVGGQQVWNLLAGGDAVIQAAKSQVLARRWEYVLSEGAKRALADDDTIAVPRASGADFDRISGMPQPEWLTGFLPPQLQEVLLAPAQAAWAAGEGFAAETDGPQRLDARLDALAEIRPVSVVFARVAGIDDHDPLALSRHQELCTALQETSRARGGPPGELLIDDKGLVFIAAFGARGSFHRDDPHRAVDAARAIGPAVRDFGLSVSVGVATGDALFRVVGGARRRQLMVLGPPVNRAARLMTAVSGDVLCDAPTERASRMAFSFEKRGTLQLEGLGDMAPVFRPLEARPTALPPAALIGRHNELEFLKRSFEETRAGGNQLVAVLGEPGIGKTALVNAFTAELRAFGITVSVARAERDDRHTSLLAWRRVLESLLGLSPDGDGFIIVDALARRLDSNAPITGRLPLLADLLGIDLEQNEGTRHLDGAHRADATMRLMGELIDVLAPHPLAVVLEDSQWLDSASWRLLEWVLGSSTSVMLILCVRSEEVPDELRSLRNRMESARMNPIAADVDDPARFCRILDLEELDDRSIGKLVGRTLGDAPPQEELAHRISTLASGNPFFAEEISLTLRGEGLIAIREGAWRPIRPLDGLRYFEGVERVVRERVDRLEPAARDVLKAAAVVGRSFSDEAVAKLTEKEFDRGVLAAAFELLVAANLVRCQEGGRSYEFRHDQIRDVVYGSIPGDVRQRLHQALAGWMEGVGATLSNSDIAFLVQHFEAAGNVQKSVKYADLAATKALKVGAFREVGTFLEICFSHEPRQQPLSPADRRQAVRWRRQLAEAQYSRGDIHAQGVAIRRALSLAGVSVPHSRLGTAVRLIRGGARLALQQLWRSPTASGESDRAWAKELARCHNQAVVVEYFELRFTHGLIHLLAAVTQAERAGFSGELAVASAQLGCGFGILGRKRLCKHFIERAEQTSVTLADPAVHAHVCMLDALWRIGHCDWAAVDQRLDQSQALCLAAGDQLRWCNAQVIRFWSLFYRGDWTALEAVAQGLLSRAQNSGNIQHEIWALRCKSTCVLYTDSPREAVDILRLITSAMPESADISAHISCKGSLALALARVGSHAESVQAAVETLQLLQRMGRPTAHSTLLGIIEVCEVLLRGREAGLSREYDQWGHWEAQGLYELKRFCRTFPVGIAQYGLWRGVALWLDGRTKRALKVWKQAFAVASRLSLLQDKAMISAEIRRRRDQI
ncbi:Adenylate and Guanylate cyclase catalytic domain-containing protein [Mesorhizobium albiziae]|uniref:Adenylate and Guanylate cyclase catalytic domain-containing protein n=1 Tax=Neomesorhizobium albiziae TaxID=335020 RepID=A0A1I4E313_9HYPH|nr:adenylate/guanylate cyclase domain-containing protein [Mesorhizobium albiziae]GLS32502.1 adenylyl cyclase [Mesorhizobium albiziae]SFL00228.1 Adenylate and Guanylate cyclase catalytic domain-containing protein [Mesorhizobium albiziae]